MVFVPLSVENSRRGSTGEKVKISHNDCFITKKMASLELVSIIYTKYAINIKSFLNSSSPWCIALPVFVNVLWSCTKMAAVKIKLSQLLSVEKGRSRIFAPLKASLQHAHLN